MEIQLKSVGRAQPVAAAGNRSVLLETAANVRALIAVFKLRIAVSIALSALGGAVVAGQAWPAFGQAWLLLAAVLLASFGAAGFNHYLERDIDRRMCRTRRRPFASGRFGASAVWPLLFALMIATGSALAGRAFGLASGLFVLAGALTYVVVYTAWLKRLSDWNIVIGGAAGSFAVLAGAAVHGVWLDPAALWLALVLLLWTPSHFWALSIALVEDYRAAGLPMLPVTRGVATAARWTMVNSVLLVVAAVGLGWVLESPLFWLFSLTGSAWLLVTGLDLVRSPTRPVAMTAFFASLIQLGLLLAGLFLNAWVG